jgi:hypothetical protein
MIDADSGKSSAALALAVVASFLTGCSQSDGPTPVYYPTSVYGSSLPPIGVYDTSDPYHYRCRGQCLGGF